MFEALKEGLKETRVFIAIGVTMTFLIILAALKLSEVQPITAHDMGDGIICYTFNTSIDCLQVDR